MHNLPHVRIDRLEGSSLTECDKCKSYEHLVSCPFVEAAKLEEIKGKEHTLSDSYDCQYYWYTELHTHTHTRTHARTHTHTHTHIPVLDACFSSSMLFVHTNDTTYRTKIIFIYHLVMHLLFLEF